MAKSNQDRRIDQMSPEKQAEARRRTEWLRSQAKPEDQDRFKPLPKQ